MGRTPRLLEEAVWGDVQKERKLAHVAGQVAACRSIIMVRSGPPAMEMRR